MSENKKPVDFKNIIDTIATYYILTMDFKNLSKLSEKEHCDKMLVLTSDIIGKYFTLQQISFLEQRVQNGEQSDVMENDKVIYMTKEQLESLDIDANKKERVCLGIAKFYIIIAHVFAAIVMTINPIYTYVDESGVKHEYNINEKDKIPKDATTSVRRLNICKNRIDNLQSGQETIVNDANGNIDVSPNICSINLMSNGNVKSLSDEPGIPELKQLYLDEQYDFTTGKFKGMTKETEQQYNSDLKQFYTVFTGNTDMPEDIKDFSDIKLKNYQADEKCLNNKFKSSYSGNVKNDLFAKYANNIKLMIERANAKQDELLKIINILFTYVVDERTGNKKVKINPKLNDAKLSMVVKNTRKIIIDLYSKCENDYLEGVKIYEAIVDTIGFSTLITQEQNLNQTVEDLSAPFVTPVSNYDKDTSENKSNYEPLMPQLPPNETFVSPTTPATPIIELKEPVYDPTFEPEPLPEPEPAFVSPATPTTPIITSNESGFEPVPEPVPTFEPVPEPVPTFEPEPEPTFEPEPEPTFEPEPEPVPTFEHELEPTFEPEPEPTFEPEPEPTFEPEPEPTFVSPATPATPTTPIITSNESVFEPGPTVEPINVPAHNIFTFNIAPAHELIAKGKENENVSYNSQTSTLPQPIQESSGGKKKITRRKHKQHKKRKTRKHKTK